MKKYILLIFFSTLMIGLVACGEPSIERLKISLNPGVDTIDVDSEHIDSGAKAYYGLRKLDIEVISYSVDISTPGVYEIIYYATYLDFEKTITRIVTVVDDKVPDVHLNIGLDTIYVGDQWTDTGVTSDDQIDVLISGYVNINIAGEYIITYTINDGQLVLKRYVNVIEE